MFEKDNAKTVHSKKAKKNHKYDMAEMESRRSEEAYKWFVQPPYYLEGVKNERAESD